MARFILAFLVLIFVSSVNSQTATDSTGMTVSARSTAPVADTVINLDWQRVITCKADKVLKIKLYGTAIDTNVIYTVQIPSSMPVGTKYLKLDSVQVHVSMHQFGIVGRKISNNP